MQRNQPERVPATSGTMAAIDAAGWGLFLVWVGICLLADLGWSAFFVGTGVLMLLGQMARKHLGLGVDRFAALLGACFAVAGLAGLLQWRWQWPALPAWALPAVFIVIGVAFIVSAWRRGR